VARHDLAEPRSFRVDQVNTTPAVERVDPGPAAETVWTATPKQAIAAAPGPQIVVTAAADQNVVTVPAVEKVSSMIPYQPVVAPSAVDVLDAGRTVALAHLASVFIGSRMDGHAALARVTERVPAAAAVDRVRPGRRIPGSTVAIAVRHPIIAGAAEELVMTAAAVKGAPSALVAIELVVACAATEIVFTPVAGVKLVSAVASVQRAAAIVCIPATDSLGAAIDPVVAVVTIQYGPARTAECVIAWTSIDGEIQVVGRVEWSRAIIVVAELNPGSVQQSAAACSAVSIDRPAPTGGGYCGPEIRDHEARIAGRGDDDIVDLARRSNVVNLGIVVRDIPHGQRRCARRVCHDKGAHDRDEEGANRTHECALAHGSAPFTGNDGHFRAQRAAPRPDAPRVSSTHP